VKLLTQSVRWALAQQTARNIQCAIQVGDLVNNSEPGQEYQWRNIRAALDPWNGKLPYSVVRGNHDIDGDPAKSTPIRPDILQRFDESANFGPESPYAKQPGLVCFSGAAGAAQSTRNTYRLVESNGRKLLILGIDIQAQPEVREWADKVIREHPQHRVIVVTHAYMSDSGQRFNAAIDPVTKRNFDALRADILGHNEEQYNGRRYFGFDAEELWQTLLSRHANVALVLSGHQYEEWEQFKYQLSVGVHGNRVYQLLINQQAMAQGGMGWIRLLEFAPDGVTVRVKTYSPALGAWDVWPDTHYAIQLSPLAGEP
jgi:3',5'-cyclic AMP phosphodiesterase CpdA